MVAVENNDYYTQMASAAAKYAGALGALKAGSQDSLLKLKYEALEKEFAEVAKYIELITEQRVRGIKPQDSDVYSVDDSDRRI